MTYIHKPQKGREYKTFPFSILSTDPAQGIVTGYLSTWSVDRQQDQVIPGAFTDTIAQLQQEALARAKTALLPMLWMHDPTSPIGYYYTLREDSKGLYTEAQLDLSTNPQGVPNNPLAVMVFSGFEQGYIDQQSIGYDPTISDYDPGSGIRNLRQVVLQEGSAVTSGFAANSQAVILSAKSEGNLASFPTSSLFSQQKIGRTFSQTNIDAITQQIQALQTLAKHHQKMMADHHKALLTIAQDLSQVLGSPAYAGTPEEEQQEEEAVEGKALTELSHLQSFLLHRLARH